MTTRKKRIRTPNKVSAFVVSLRLPADGTLGPLAAALEAVQRHIGALCDELGGPDLAKQADVVWSLERGLFLVGTPAPEGIAEKWPEMVSVVYELGDPVPPGPVRAIRKRSPSA